MLRSQAWPVIYFVGVCHRHRICKVAETLVNRQLFYLFYFPIFHTVRAVRVWLVVCVCMYVCEFVRAGSEWKP